MLTPRRTLLLLAGFVLFAGAYLAYAQLLGWLDGLPQLPEKMLVVGEVTFRPPERAVSPTQQKLAEAFGAKSPETDYALYETQLESRTGEMSVVLAAGPAPANPDSNRVPLSPFSLAIFSRPKPLHLRAPGEVTEITTIHADKAILEFDRKITNPSEMRTAKLVRIEFISDFEQTFEDPRRGTVHITNNQKSADPNRFLVVRTPGPVFYRDAKVAAGTPAAQGPDFWTDAPVEIVDRQNLPRPIGSGAPATVAGKGEDTRTTAVVAEIIAGRRAPPPTVTGVGLRIYLEPDPPPGQPKPKKSDGGLHGVRRIDLLEQVVVNLWIDNGQSLVGGPPPPDAADAPKGSSLALTPPPAALAAVTGGLGTAAYNVRLMNRALLQIETRGPFAYDAEKALARFDVVPHSDPNLPNDVQVTKVPARGGTSSLFSQVLELELNGGPTAAARPANAPAIKRLHAWTYTAGRFLTVAAQDEAMEAYGQDLTHDQTASRTVLTGAPLYVVRERNVLSAGAPQRPATLTTEPGPLPDRKSQMTVRGAGRVELFDTASNSNTLTATWQTSLVQIKEVIGGREQDLFTFTDGAKFEDVKADYWLKGNVLKLWLEPRTEPPGSAPQTATAKPLVGPPAPPRMGIPPAAVAGAPAPKSGGQPQPARILAVGTVTSHSAEYDVDQADQLNVFFADGKAVAALAPANPLVPPAAGAEPPVARPLPPPGGEPPVARPGTGPMAVAVVPKEPEKPKPPMKIRAKTIDTWVTRIPAPPAPAAKPDPNTPAEPPANAVKYQLDKAHCEDNVVVHQDPTDPSKPRGVDILGRLLLIDGSVDGSVMTVFGWPNRPGEVHQEEMSLIGPKVVLDQVHNASSVEGRGALTMPTNSDLAGGELAQAEVVVIHWRDSMSFKGAQRSAEFVGKVSARQGESWVLCHTMHVVFDRPVYFNQTQKRAAPQPKGAAADDKPKIDTVYCYPAAADSADDKQELTVTYNQVEFDKTGKTIKSQRLTAQELKMEAQARDTAGGEPYQCVKAFGPGVLRIWQAGDKDPSGPAPAANKPGQPAPMPPMPKPPAGQPMAPVQPGAKPPPDEQEMKLTVVTFSGNMTAIDKAKVFQKATFENNVTAISVPADSPNVEVERHRLPPRALLLTCDKELVVWTHKKGNAPPVQRMDAFGNAYLRSDDYDGWGETISHDGKLVLLTGSEAIPARIMERFNTGNDRSGKKIRYNRADGSYSVIEGFGGTLGGGKK